MGERRAWVERITTETAVGVTVTLRSGPCTVATGIGFLDHMLDTLARHAAIGLEVEARGDLQVDAHHTVEDVALTLGQALDQALGDRSGVARFGHAYAPMDEALARAVVDLSGRPFFRLGVPDHLVTSWVTREFPFTLVGEFWRAFASRAKLTLHVDLERGVDPHHSAEAIFKAVALSLRQALAGSGGGVLSAKGTLTA